MLVLAALFVALFAMSARGEQTLQVKRAGCIYLIPQRQQGSVEQVELTSFAAALSIETSADSNGAWLTIHTTDRIVLRDGLPWARVGNRIQQLLLPVERIGTAYWVPRDWAVPRLTEGGAEDAEFDASANILVMTPGKAVWRGIEIEQADDDALQLRLAIPPGPKIEATRNDSAVNVKVFGVRANDKLFAMPQPSDYVKRIHCDFSSDPPHITLVLNYMPLAIDSIDARTRLIRLKDVARRRTAHFRETRLAAAKQRWTIDCVVIDAGHGGRDPGAIANGMQEKDITLDIAQRLAARLRTEAGVRVIMTRDGDVFVPLQERGRIANRGNGKLFVSIHVNASRDGDVRGVETYFLSPARTARAIAVAEFENAVVRLEEDSASYQPLNDENFILLSMAQAQFLIESQRLADHVQQETVKRTRLPDLGVDQAGFYVLIGASMPAILFECAFLTNSKDAKILRSSEFRRQIAEALAAAILEFRRRSM